MPTLRCRTRSPAQAVRTVALVSLGCPKNLVDSEKMLGLLAQDGLIPVSTGPGEPLAADAVVINTCGFLESARQESLEVIHEALRAKERGDVRRVVVAGCLVQRHRARVLQWAPGVDALVGVFDRDHIVHAVRGQRPDRASPDDGAPPYWIAASALQAARRRGVATASLTVAGRAAPGYFEDDSARLRLTPRHYAYLRISEGCNQNCSFCTIPSIRGKMRSKPPERIVAEARELLADGCFELNLIGQDTTSYGADIGCGFDEHGSGVFGRGGLPDLLRALDETVAHAGGGWIRLMYAYPSNFRPEFVQALADLCAAGRLTPYIDIPLQHASDRILSSMRRRVTAEQQRRLLLDLRRAVPGIAIRTTFITGYPGETEDDHRALLEFIDQMRFEAMGVFEYSPEPGTPAARLEADPDLAVPAEVKARRRDELMQRQQDIAFSRAAGDARAYDPADPASGVRVDVLIDGPAGDAAPPPPDGARVFVGRTATQAPDVDPVTFVWTRQPLAPGELVPCTVVGADGYDLIARPREELQRRTSLPVVA